jgi:two-component system phosphate regulon sensor histidine kinase PhoR
MGRKLKRNKENLVQITNETSALMSSIDEGIVSINLERKVFFFNSQFAGQFISSHQSFESKIILAEVFRQPEVVELFENVLKSGLPDKKVVKLSTLMNESERYFNISVTPLKREKDQNIYGATGVFSDVTELKKTSLIRMDFVTNASHELRTPLTSVYGYLETLKEDFESKRYEEVSKFLGIVTKNVQRLQSLVNDLLTLAQIESQIEQQPEIINPCELTQHILSQMSSLAQKKNQSIHFNCQVQTLFGFSRQIEQVIGNLLSNAIKYSGEGKKIELIWQQSETEVQFIVKDQGLGISEEHIPRLFERFYRVDPSRSREIGGTGLGLSIVKHVMMNHQGHVKVQSSVGEGSQFICTFPVVTF